MTTNIYQREGEIVARQCWARWNRDPASPSFGSFDRAYWGWKYKDFSDATLQAGIRLALDWADTIGSDADLEYQLAGFARFCAGVQHRDGSFDQCYPHERTPGVGLDVLTALIAASRRSRTGETKQLLHDVLVRSVGFILKTDEVHGIVANHLISFSFELLGASDFLGDAQAKARADSWLERALGAFDTEEGWFNEYQGPDPGYQTRALSYLTQIAERAEYSSLWGVCENAARFVEAMMMPDGSLHPSLGVRGTALLYPSGFERLARRNEDFELLAESVRAAWSRETVPLPSSLDFDNALRLGQDAWDASRIAPQRSSDERAPDTARDIYLPRARIKTKRSASIAVYTNVALGSVVAWTRLPGDDWRLAYEHSGYLLTGSPPLSTRAPNAGRILSTSPGVWLESEHGFSPVLHEELSTLKLMLLRILNLTVLRVQFFADLFRKLLVGRLIASKHGDTKGRVKRRICLTLDGVEITDEIELPIGRADVQLLSCRRLTSAHMASSRYFQRIEIEGPPLCESVSAGHQRHLVKAPMECD